MGIGPGWYYNTVSGDVVHASAITSLGEGAIPGWHGPYKTEAQAIAHTGVIGAPAKANESVIGGAESAGKNAIPGTTSVTQFLGSLSSRSMWTRIAEGALGTALILVGVAKLAEGTPTAAAIRKIPII